MEDALKPFRDDIVDLENIVLRDAHTPLTLILCRVEKYVCLFNVLNCIIREVGIGVVLFIDHLFMVYGNKRCIIFYYRSRRVIYVVAKCSSVFTITSTRVYQRLKLHWKSL